MLAGLSPARRRVVLAVLVLALAVAVLACVVVAVSSRGRRRRRRHRSRRTGRVRCCWCPATAARPGSLQAARRRAHRRRPRRHGRRGCPATAPATSTPRPTPSARRSTAALARTGEQSVDVVGYSAGGLVARLWVADGHADVVRRVVTLGSPHHGTSLADLAGDVAPGQCPLGCQQMASDSDLLAAPQPRGRDAGRAHLGLDLDDAGRDRHPAGLRPARRGAEPDRPVGLRRRPGRARRPAARPAGAADGAGRARGRRPGPARRRRLRPAGRLVGPRAAPGRPRDRAPAGRGRRPPAGRWSAPSPR